MIFSITGNVVKLFPNYIKFKEEGGFFIDNGINSFADIYFYAGKLRFREQASDTLFYLNDRLELVPEIIFDLCGRNIPTNMRGNNFFTNRKSYTIINSMVEMGNRIFLSCDFGDKTPAGFTSNQELWYDKNNKKMTILKQDFLGQKRIKIPSANTPGVSVNSSESEQLIDSYRKGIINDIDGGFDFFPSPGMTHNQNNQQLVCAVYLPFKILENLNEEHFASKEIKNKEANVRLRNLLKNLKEDDNPVLMIATFK